MLNKIKSLAGAGVSVIPVRKNDKIPTQNNWSELDKLTPDQVSKQAPKWHNYGIRPGAHSKLASGDFLITIDLDIKDASVEKEALAKLYELIPHIDEFCVVHSGNKLGLSRHYVGTTNKALRSGRLWKHPKKITWTDGKTKDAAQIDIIGTGKQHVGPGSMHPDGFKYELADAKDFDSMLDDISNGTRTHYIAAKELDVRDGSDRPVTRQKIDSFEDAVAHGPVEMTDDEIRDVLKNLPEKRIEDHDDWIQLLMAIKHQFPDDEDYACDLAEWVSKKSNKFEDERFEEAWESIRNDKGTGNITFRSLIKEANESRRNKTKLQNETDGPPRRPSAVSLNLHRMDALDAMPEPEELIQDVLYQFQFSTLIGQPSVGKSFTAIDMGMHLATGRPWHGKEVEQGGVVFVALEGVQGFRKRLKAWAKTHAFKDLDSLPVAVIDGSLNLRTDKAARKWIIERCKELEIEWGVPIRLIVIDTLNRAMAGGNESSSEDMGALIAGADEIRHATQAHLMLLHHPGKDDSKGARGHSSLFGAVDTEITITGNDRKRSMKITKQKEGEDGAKFNFELERVELYYRNRRGEPVSSAVAIPFGDPMFSELSNLDDRQRRALDILQTVIRRVTRHAKIMGDDFGDGSIPVETWRAQLKKNKWPSADITPDAFRNAYMRLKKAPEVLKHVEFDGDLVKWRDA